MSQSVEALFTEATKPGSSVHAITLGTVNKTGKPTIKPFGRQTLSPAAPPLHPDATFKIASCTKLVTTIAALQCVDRAQTTLDAPVSTLLPELSSLPIIHPTADANTPSYTKPTTQITLRHLLTHSSGLAYDALSPALTAWRAARGESAMGYPSSGTVAQCFATPLVFEPGTGWAYGPGLDWVGVLVRRLNGGVSLEEHFAENIFKIVGCAEPLPTFDLGKEPRMRERLVECGERGEDGGLQPVVAPYGEDPRDEHGGTGLVLAVGDYLAVLADLISDEPKLLRRDTIAELFSPQFSPGSAPLQGLHGLSMIWSPLTGGVVPPGVNHGLGGLLLTEDADAAGIPASTLLWGGFTNPTWQVNRNRGAAGFFATQILPPGDAQVVKLIGAFWKDFWSKH